MPLCDAGVQVGGLAVTISESGNSGRDTRVPKGLVGGAVEGRGGDSGGRRRTWERQGTLGSEERAVEESRRGRRGDKASGGRGSWSKVRRQTGRGRGGGLAGGIRGGQWGLRRGRTEVGGLEEGVVMFMWPGRSWVGVGQGRFQSVVGRGGVLSGQMAQRPPALSPASPLGLFWPRIPGRGTPASGQRHAAGRVGPAFGRCRHSWGRLAVLSPPDLYRQSWGNVTWPIAGARGCDPCQCSVYHIVTMIMLRASWNIINVSIYKHFFQSSFLANVQKYGPYFIRLSWIFCYW